MTESLSERGRRALRRARDLADEVERLRDNLREMELQTVSSPNMDGMPKGSGDGDAMTRRVIRLEKLLAQLRAAERELESVRDVAAQELQSVKAAMRMFCAMYFLESATMEESCQFARISTRTGEGYRAAVNKAE